MPDPASIPVLVVCGADADGLAALLANDNDRIVAETWQGPSSVLLAPDVARRSPGLVSSALRLDVVDSVLRAARRARRPSRILLVAGEEDDVATIAYTLLSDADLMRHVHVAGVVLAIDAVAATTRLATAGRLAQHCELDALAMADLIVLARSAELTGDAWTSLSTAIRERNTLGHMISHAPSTPGSDDSDLCRAVRSLDAWRRPPVVRNGHPQLPRARCGGPHTFVLREATPLVAHAVDAWIDRLVDADADGLLRVQGAFSLESTTSRVVCSGVRSFAISQCEAGTRLRMHRRESVVVVVGHGFDADELAADFAATRVR